MISICITYLPRKKLLEKTLGSIFEQNDVHREIVIIEDEDKAELQLAHCIKIKETGNTPVYPTNASIFYSKGDKILIQNAECYHVGNVLKYVEDNLTDDNYIAFPCFSLDKGNTDGQVVLGSVMRKHKRAAGFDGDNGWYNHAVYRPSAIPFCAAITRKNLKKLGNVYDELFNDGYGWADIDFVRRVRLLGLKVEIPEFPMVVHQWHYTGEGYEHKPGYKDNELLADMRKSEGNIKTKNKKYKL